MDDFRQLRHLIALCRHGTLTAAADSLGITKSTLSQSIKRIEDIYGVTLFERDHHGIRPTPYAQILLEIAEQGMTLLANASRRIRDLKARDRWRLDIGCDPFVSELLLPPTLARITAEFPKVQFSVRPGTWPQLVEALRNKEIDLYVGIKPDGPTSDFRVKEFELSGIVTFCRRGHPLCGREAVTLGEVYDYTVIGYDLPDWFIGRVWEETRAEKGVDLSSLQFVFVSDAGTLREIVKSSDAVSGGFRQFVERDDGLAVLPSNSYPVNSPVPFIVAVRDDKEQLPLALQVFDLIEQVASELAQGNARNDAGPLNGPSFDFAEHVDG